MTLHHKSFGQKSRTDIIADGGSENERIVGHATRSPFPLGGYVYTAEQRRIYSGNSMKDGMAKLEAAIAAQVAQ